MHKALLALAFLAVLNLGAVGGSGMPSIELYRSGLKELSPQAKEKIVAWAEKFLESANLNTANQPEILKQSVIEIQKRYRKTVRGDFLVVSFDQPVTFHTAGGDVKALEIIVGLNAPNNVAIGLFTIDPDGRIVAHEKYDPMLPPELVPQNSGGGTTLPSN
jgi:TusA-related sulfurtransferase